MELKPFLGLLAYASGLAAAATIPQENAFDKRADCVVNSVWHETWDERGYDRHRVKFSSGGPDAPDPATFCEHWDVQSYRNLQCYEHEEHGWVVDSNWEKGAGWRAFNVKHDGARRDWMVVSRCGTS